METHREERSDSKNLRFWHFIREHFTRPRGIVIVPRSMVLAVAEAENWKVFKKRNLFEMFSMPSATRSFPNSMTDRPITSRVYEGQRLGWML